MTERAVPDLSDDGRPPPEGVETPGRAAAAGAASDRVEASGRAATGSAPEGVEAPGRAAAAGAASDRVEAPGRAAGPAPEGAEAPCPGAATGPPPEGVEAPGRAAGSAPEGVETPGRAAAGSAPDRRRESPGPDAGFLRVGYYAWASLGIAGVLVGGWLLAGLLAVVVVPLLLALFPAALLTPAVGWLDRHGLPRPLATLVVVLVAVAVVGGVLALLVPAFVAQLPELTRSLNESGTRLDDLVHRVPAVEDTATVGDLIRRGVLWFLGGVDAALLAALNIVLGLLLVLVLLVCYLGGGQRIVATGVALLPRRRRAAARDVLDEVWQALGSYIRALLLVALFDASAVGLGLWLLDVPLVLPLAVLVFMGAFIPYVGAFVSGLFAVLVALADAGLGTAVAVLVLVVVVQQVDGNVVQPLLVGKAVRLSVFTVIVAVGIGASLLGVLGAFLAVPAAACLTRAVKVLRERERPEPDLP